MKRLATILICALFGGYLLVWCSAINTRWLGLTPFLKSPLQQVKMFSGVGVLFVKDASLQKYATQYRFYQQGAWQNWQQLEEPLFNEYISTGRLASLKHNRLDRQLVKTMVAIGRRQGVAKMSRSMAFKVFMQHLFYAHNQGLKPDSVAIRYNSIKKHKAILAFKCKP